MKGNFLIRNFLISAAVISLILQTVNTARAAFGDADPSFGSAGIFTDTALDYEPSAMARQSDGKIVAVGRRHNSDSGAWELVVRRYLANGSVDAAFGWNGRAVSYNVGGWGLGVVIQKDGKIAVVGVAPPIDVNFTSTAVWRFNADGWYDSAFGNNGRAAGWGNGYCDIAAFQPSRSAGNELIVSCNGGELFRLKSNGAVNTSFGSGGLATTGASSYAMAYHSGGIYVTGIGTIRKFTPNGLPDQTFGTGGLFNQTPDYSCLIPYPGGNGYYKSLDFKSDGRIIIAGDVNYNFGYYYGPLLTAHQPDGAFDPSFSGLPCPGPSSFPDTTFYYPVQVRVDSLDRIVTGASAIVERRNADGTFDGSYSLSTQTIVDVAVLPDNRILTLAPKEAGGIIRARFTQRLP